MSFARDVDLRRLSAEEVALWLAAMHDIAPRSSAPGPQSTAALSEPKNVAKSKEQTDSAKAFRPPGLAPLEPRARRKLARGRLAIDAAIDLHGMRQQEAHRALLGFLSRAQREGAKIVLVVTGKGESRPAEEERGVLRRAVPLWLNAPEWRHLIVGFEEATRTHGGAGALYVRLRRRKNQS